MGQHRKLTASSSETCTILQTLLTTSIVMKAQGIEALTTFWLCSVFPRSPCTQLPFPSTCPFSNMMSNLSLHAWHCIGLTRFRRVAAKPSRPVAARVRLWFGTHFNCIAYRPKALLEICCMRSGLPFPVRACLCMVLQSAFMLHVSAADSKPGPVRSTGEFCFVQGLHGPLKSLNILEFENINSRALETP